ncbi:MAG: hypothetical protein ACLQKA_19185 [Bryobacteraceae bacterium]
MRDSIGPLQHCDHLPVAGNFAFRGRARDSAVLGALREMPQWRDCSQAAFAAAILACIGGIPDDQVNPAKAPEILRAVQ